jgi:steroid 5-alpha reductase family enzyme
VPPLHLWLYVYFSGDSVVVTSPGGAPSLTALGGLAICGTVWGLRLTYNFYRRGGYQRGGEDYRWEHVREWPVWRYRALWHLFSFSFISVFQQWLLWAITLPALASQPNTPLTPFDKAIMLGMLLFVALEATADQQQWNFQNEKRDQRPRRRELEGDYALGFLTHGLFARSRHPNVWCEQQVWLTLYGVSLVRWGLFNWSGVGVAALVLLTLRSCLLTEQLAIKKYPAYRAYCRAVPMLVPSVFSCRPALNKALEAAKTKSK